MTSFEDYDLEEEKKDLHRMKRLNEALEMQKNGFSSAELSESIGEIYMYYGDYEQAYDQLKRAIDSNSKPSTPHEKIASVLFHQGETEEAIHHIEYAIKKKNGHPKYWQKYGTFLQSIGKLEQAHVAFLKAEEIQPTAISAINLADSGLKINEIGTYKKYIEKFNSRAIKMSYSSHTEKNTLTVVFSPFPNKFILQNYNFEGDVLHILDASKSYYTQIAEQISDHITNICSIKKYKKIILLGSSKGATGAFIAAYLLSNSLPNTALEVIAFSPQTLLWPFNLNLSIPSYFDLHELSKGNDILRKKLIKYGNIDKLLNNNSKDFDATIIYGEHYKMDCIESSHIKAPYVLKKPIPFSAHNSLMVYTLPENATKEDILLKYAGAQNTDSDSEHLSASSPLWIDELFEITKDKNINLKNYLGR